MQKKAVFFLVFFLALSFAACNGEASHYVPAVVEDGGGLVRIDVKATPGTGQTFITTYPHTGVATQQSINNAVSYVFSKISKPMNECDILVSIDGNIAEYVDGPSAGVALSVLTYAAVEGRHLRDDATVTGAVDAAGNVGRVGGLYEKARVISRNHIKYFLTPIHSLHERVLLSNILRTSDLEIIEIENLGEAIDFMIFNKSIEKKPLAAPDRALPAIDAYDSSDLDDFKAITLNLIEIERSVVNKIKTDETEVKEIKNLFLNEISRQQQLAEKGYLFSAANEAFLDYIDASTVVDMSDPDVVDLTKKANSIMSCLGNLSSDKKTDKNFEWLIGADLRKAWADQRISRLDINGRHLAEEEYFLYNQIMYADGWCMISTLLRDTAQGMDDSTGIDESLWKLEAQKRIIDVQKLNISDEDLLDHFETAKILFSDGKYGAAAFDATFVSSMYEAGNALATSASDVLLKSSVDKLKNTKRISLWGRIYQTQGAFLSQGSNSDFASAYKLLKYAENLDALENVLRGSIRLTESGTPANQTISQPQNSYNQFTPQSPEPPKSDAVTCFPGFIFVFVVAILYSNRFRKIRCS